MNTMPELYAAYNALYTVHHISATVINGYNAMPLGLLWTLTRGVKKGTSSCTSAVTGT